MATFYTTADVVVWEWMNEFHRWRPYDPNVSNFIENSTPNGGSLCLGNIDPKLRMYTVDLQKLIQYRHHTGTTRPIRRKEYLSDSPPGKGIVWKWAGDQQGEWHVYDLDIACEIEKAKNANQTMINLQQMFQDFPYTINFRSTGMTQQRNDTGFTRRVERSFLPMCYKYVITKTTSLPKVDRKRSLNANDAGANTSYGHSNKRRSPYLPSAPHSGITPLPGTGFTLLNPLPSASYPLASTLPSYSASSQDRVFGSSQSSSHSSQPSYLPAISTQSSSINPARPTMCSHAHSHMATSGTANPNGAFHSNSFPPNIPGPYTRSTGRPSVLTSHSSIVHPGSGLNLQSSANPLSSSRLSPRRAAKQSRSIQLKEKLAPTSAEDVLHNYVTVHPSPPGDEDCCICCEKLNMASGYDDKDPIVFQLQQCNHMFHKACLHAMYENGHKDGSIQCPTCKTIYGKKFGNCPMGTMECHSLPHPLPAHEDCGTIQILYKIPSGIQGPEHPHPGQRYTARGFPRQGYLPDNEKGRKVLKLLIEAWERRLIFTIGMSTTTGEQDTVTWNEIHHKTEFGSNNSGHGYPDPNYLDNVIAELAVQGVEEENE